MKLPVLEGDTPQERLASLCEAVPGRIVFTTSFGLEDQALTHMIREAKLAIEIATLDTGRLFAETHALWADTEARYGLRIRSHHPDPEELATLLDDWGANGFYLAKDARLACCGVRKVGPLKQALSDAEAWVTGLRADQSQARGDIMGIEYDEGHGLIKTAPLFDWTRDDVAEFCAANDVPVNPLHAEGYLSIGCQPCTRAISPGEPERAGRWWWEEDAAKECGLHVDDAGRLVRAREPVT